MPSAGYSVLEVHSDLGLGQVLFSLPLLLVVHNLVAVYQISLLLASSNDRYSVVIQQSSLAHLLVHMAVGAQESVVS